MAKKEKEPLPAPLGSNRFSLKQRTDDFLKARIDPVMIDITNDLLAGAEKVYSKLGKEAAKFWAEELVQPYLESSSEMIVAALAERLEGLEAGGQGAKADLTGLEFPEEVPEETPPAEPELEMPEEEAPPPPPEEEA